MTFCLIYNYRFFLGFETGIETSVMEDDEAGRSYLRGAFGDWNRYAILKRPLSIGDLLCLPRPRRGSRLSHEKFMLDAKVLES